MEGAARGTALLRGTDGQEEFERSVIAGHRWWTVEELRQADGVVSPVGLADLVVTLLRNSAPARPARLPWRDV